MKKTYALPAPAFVFESLAFISYLVDKSANLILGRTRAINLLYSHFLPL